MQKYDGMKKRQNKNQCYFSVLTHNNFKKVNFKQKMFKREMSVIGCPNVSQRPTICVSLKDCLTNQGGRS